MQYGVKELLNACTEVRFASFLPGGFTTMALISPPERKLAKRMPLWPDVAAGRAGRRVWYIA